MAGTGDPSAPATTPSMTTSSTPAHVLMSRSDPSDILVQSIANGPKYNLYQAFQYSSDSQIAAMETIRRTDCDPMLTEAY